LDCQVDRLRWAESVYVGPTLPEQEKAGIDFLPEASLCFFMGHSRRVVTRAGLILLALGEAICAASAAGAAEFYSWITPDGTMVVTDDASRIPPEGERSPVNVHRFKDSPRAGLSSTVSDASVRATLPDTDATSSLETRSNDRPSVMRDTVEAEPADQDLSAVSLEEPTQPTLPDYRWVSLTTPLYLTSGPISGFWCRRHVKDPLRALVDHLRAMNLWTGAGPMTLNGNGGYRWGVIPEGPVAGLSGSSSVDPVSDRVLREQQAVIERNYLLLKAAQQEIARVSPSCCGGATSKTHHSSNTAKR
jgi:hypothetical protein